MGSRLQGALPWEVGFAAHPPWEVGFWSVPWEVGFWSVPWEVGFWSSPWEVGFSELPLGSQVLNRTTLLGK